MKSLFHLVISIVSKEFFLIIAMYLHSCVYDFRVNMTDSSNKPSSSVASSTPTTQQVLTINLLLVVVVFQYFNESIFQHIALDHAHVSRYARSQVPRGELSKMKNVI